VAAGHGAGKVDDPAPSWTKNRFKPGPARADALLVTGDFAARCRSCEFTWNTPAMAEGLRVIGACPRCSGELEFGARAREAREAAPAGPIADAAPHMVLGVPRR
jgi:hypothetical protein